MMYRFNDKHVTMRVTGAALAIVVATVCGAAWATTCVGNEWTMVLVSLLPDGEAGDTGYSVDPNGLAWRTDAHFSQVTGSSLARLLVFAPAVSESVHGEMTLWVERVER